MVMRRKVSAVRVGREKLEAGEPAKQRKRVKRAFRSDLPAFLLAYPIALACKSINACNGCWDQVVPFDGINVHSRDTQVYPFHRLIAPFAYGGSEEGSRLTDTSWV